jgi:5-methylcytosine-specific restriction protein A
MKICWDTLEKVKYNKKTGNFRVGRNTYYEIAECLSCKESFLGQKSNYICSNECRFSYYIGENHPGFGKLGKDNPSYGQKRPQVSLKISGENHYLWKGGYYTKNIPLYNTYASQLEPYGEQCRRNTDDPNILEVKCTYCGKWYIPKTNIVRSRIAGIKTNDLYKFYCSDNCKQECPIYKRVSKYKGQEGYSSREVQPELRQMTFARDEYICVKCGSTGPLHCHHIDPVKLNPIESADIDNCITFCIECHKEAHQLPGCGYGELRECNNLI